MKRLCILLPMVVLFLCWGTGNRGFLVIKMEQFFILGTDHVLAQTDREKTEDISQSPNQEEDLRGCLKRCYTSQATHHQVDHGHAEHGFTRLGHILIIL